MPTGSPLALLGRIKMDGTACNVDVTVDAA